MLGDPVEKLRELDETPVALDEPLPIGEARLRHLAHELNVLGERGAFGYFDHGGGLAWLAPGAVLCDPAAVWLGLDHRVRRSE